MVSVKSAGWGGSARSGVSVLAAVDDDEARGVFDEEEQPAKRAVIARRPRGMVLCIERFEEEIVDGLSVAEGSERMATKGRKRLKKDAGGAWRTVSWETFLSEVFSAGCQGEDDTEGQRAMGDQACGG